MYSLVIIALVIKTRLQRTLTGRQKRLGNMCHPVRQAIAGHPASRYAYPGSRVLRLPRGALRTRSPQDCRLLECDRRPFREDDVFKHKIVDVQAFPSGFTVKPEIDSI